MKNETVNPTPAPRPLWHWALPVGLIFIAYLIVQYAANLNPQ